MFRRILLILAALIAAPSVLADPIETLLKAAHAADYAGVEAQIKAAPDRTAQRDLVWALAATDPDTAAFTKAWVRRTAGQSHRTDRAGLVVLEAKSRYDLLRERMAAGTAPAHSDADLAEVYLCPYLRAVHIVDAICAEDDPGVNACLLDSVWSAPSESGLKNSLYADIAGRGGCKAELAASVQDLPYDLVALKPAP